MNVLRAATEMPCVKRCDRTEIYSDLEPEQKEFSRVLNSGLDLPLTLPSKVGAQTSELMKTG